MGSTRLDDSKFLRGDKTETADNKVLTSAVADFGAWVELFPSTLITHNYITVQLHNNNTSNLYEVEIGEGAAGAEVAKIKGILYHVDLTGNNEISQSSNYKVEVPVGMRIAARVKATLVTDTIEIKLNAQGT